MTPFPFPPRGECLEGPQHTPSPLGESLPLHGTSRPASAGVGLGVLK